MPHVQKHGPEFDGCSLRQCASGLLVAYDTQLQRFATAEVGFDHTAPCCSSSSVRSIAVADAYVAFSSHNQQLVVTGEDDFMRVFRAPNPFEAP